MQEWSRWRRICGQWRGPILCLLCLQNISETQQCVPHEHHGPEPMFWKMYILATGCYCIKSLKWWHVYSNSTYIARGLMAKKLVSHICQFEFVMLNYDFGVVHDYNLATTATEACGQNQNWEGSGQATVPWLRARGCVVLYTLIMMNYIQSFFSAKDMVMFSVVDIS